MNPELDHRLAALADAAARATTGIDPAVTLTMFRRRRRIRRGATAVAAAVAVVGLALGVAQLDPPGADTPPASPTISRSPAPSPPPQESPPATGALACGHSPIDAFAALSGVPIEAHGSNTEHDMELSVDVDASDLEDSRVLWTSSIAAFPGAEPPLGAQAPYAFRIWLLVTGPDGVVVGYAEPWEQPDKRLVEGRETVLERCPKASWDGIAAPESFHVHTATAAVGEAPPRDLVLGDAAPLFRPDPVHLDGPGSCGDFFFQDGVSETVGAMAGLWVELEDAEVSRAGAVSTRLAVSNNGESTLRGKLLLTHLRVESPETGYFGSVLTPDMPVTLATEVSLRPGDTVRFEPAFEMTACADDVVPLPAGTYTVSATLELVAPRETLGFSSPAVHVTVGR